MTPQRAKEVGIIVTVLLFSMLTFGLASLFVLQGRFGSATSVAVVLAILAALWVALVALALALVQHPGSSMAISVGCAVMLIVAGLGQLPAVAAAILLGLLLTLARQTMYREINNRVLYRTSEVFYWGLRWILFGTGIAALGLAWPLFEDQLAGRNISLSPETVGVIVQRLAPALPPHLTSFVDIGLLTSVVTNSINQTLQSLIASYRGVFLLIVLVLAISAWRAVMPLLAWGILPIIAALVYLARKANLVYLSRSQATIERLHL